MCNELCLRQCFSYTSLSIILIKFVKVTVVKHRRLARFWSSNRALLHQVSQMAIGTWGKLSNDRCKMYSQSTHYKKKQQFPGNAVRKLLVQALNSIHSSNTKWFKTKAVVNKNINPYSKNAKRKQKKLTYTAWVSWYSKSNQIW